MGTVLFAWELGGGLGHLMQMLPMARGLAQRGHRVFLAARDLPSAEGVFGGTGVSILQAPVQSRRGKPQFTQPSTFAHILANCGWDQDRTLSSAANAWRELYRLVRPDLIVFDHSPGALLASRGAPARRITIGSGFCVPPDADPFPNLRPWAKLDAQQLRDDEQSLLHRVNRLLQSWRQPPLERLAQLYSQVDESFLTTFPELDHYAKRPRTRYWGPVNGSGGGVPIWPEGEGKRVYAYLKKFDALPELLGFLNERRLPSIIFVDGVDAEVQEKFASRTMRFETERLDLGRIGRECDLALINGNHGTTSAMMMAGKPMLQLPLFLEQMLMARNIRRLGTGLDASTKRPAMILDRLEKLLTGHDFAERAREVAGRFARFDPQQQSEAMVRRAAQILEEASRRTSAPARAETSPFRVV